MHRDGNGIHRPCGCTKLDRLYCTSSVSSDTNRSRGGISYACDRSAFIRLVSQCLCRFASNLQLGKASIKLIVAHRSITLPYTANREAATSPKRRVALYSHAAVLAGPAFILVAMFWAKRSRRTFFSSGMVSPGILALGSRRYNDTVETAKRESSFDQER